jgi:apolipoprotein N-acyltransferase
MVIAFPKTGSLFPLTFISWIPLLFVENYFSDKKKAGNLFVHAYFTFIVYNIGTTWWIIYASVGGALMAFFANSLLMALAFLVFHLLKRSFSRKWFILIFVSVWLTFEWLHFHWDLSWPWLTFGNVFASTPSLVQWYSITGVFGGSLWVLVTNYLIFEMINEPKTDRSQKKRITIGLLILLPIAFSLTLGVLKSTTGEDFEVVVVQPNKDPYTEKFVGSNSEQLQQFLGLALEKSTKKTNLIVGPETALYPNNESYYEWFYEDYIPQHVATKAIHAFQEKHPIPVLIGATTTQQYNFEKSAASNYEPQSGKYIEWYNSSLFFPLQKKPEVIHKSKLVLGVEKLPFTNIFPFIKTLAIDLGGGDGTLGTADAPSVFKMEKFNFAPVVCYESIYGEFVAQQSVQNSKFIAVITNDGWWRDTPGYKQHFLFSALRSIENNQWLVRSANTGTSGIFNNKGEIIHSTNWDEEIAFNATIQLLDGKTIYQTIGDLIAKIAAGIAVLFLIIASYLRFTRKKRA